MQIEVRLKCGEKYTIYTLKSLEYDSKDGIIKITGNLEPRCRAKEIVLFIEQIKDIKKVKKVKEESGKEEK